MLAGLKTPKFWLKASLLFFLMAIAAKLLLNETSDAPEILTILGVVFLGASGIFLSAKFLNG